VDVLGARREAFGERHELTGSIVWCVGRIERTMREDTEPIYSD
jgi:hypothetical protein